MEIILILILTVLLFKWAFFCLFIPFITLKEKLAKGLAGNKKSNDDVPKTISVKKKLIRSIGLFYLGLIRYYDIQVGMIPSHTIRNFIYKNIFGVKLSPKAVIYYGAEIRDHRNLKIGKGSIVGDKAILDARNGIVIGENVNFSTGVSIWTEQHDHRDPYFRCQSSPDFRVLIKDRAWIGPNVIILHSVTIGEGAVVGAGSVITKNVPPYTIVGGIPAKEINRRNPDLKYEFNGDYCHLL